MLGFSFLLALLVIVGLITFGVYLKGAKKQSQKMGAGTELFRMNQVMSMIRDEKNATKKIQIMEHLNMKPKELLAVLEKMLDLDLVRWTETTVKITEFGKHYYDNFVKGKS